MKRIYQLSYPLLLYWAVYLPTLVVTALLDMAHISAPLLTLSICPMVIVILYAGKRRRANAPPIQWLSLGSLSVITLGCMGLLSLLLIGEGFCAFVTPSIAGILSWTFFWSALMEELLFREYLYNLLKSYRVQGWAIIVLSSLYFAVCHSPQTLELFIQRCILGSLLGGAYHWSSSLPLCVSCHWALNIMLYSVTKGYDIVETYHSTLRIGAYILAGLFLVLGIIIAYCANKSKFAVCRNE